LKISCPSCEAKYSIGDDKVQSRLAKIRCRKCGVDIVIDGRVQPPTVSVGDTTVAAHESMQQAAAAATPSYTIDFGENDQRTMTLDEVVASYNAGQITPDTFIWADGMSDWTALGQIPEIVDALNAAAAAPAKSATASRSPSPTATKTTTAAATAAKASARGTGRGGADLFGAIAHAGGEEDMALQASTAPAAQVTTGARNESSVLFSLSALTSSAKSAPGPTQSRVLGSSSSAASREDSGLIDLKALTSQASDAASAALTSGGVAGLGASPLGGLGGGLGAPLGGLGAPLGGFGAPLGGAAPAHSGLMPALGDVSYPQQKNRMGLFIGGGIAVAAIVGGLVFALKPEPPPPPKVEPVKIIEYKTREPEPIKETVAKPPTTGEASATAAPKAAAPKWRAGPKPGGKASGSSGGDKESGSSAPPPTTPKPSSKCGCSPSDLACNMRCAAKGG